MDYDGADLAVIIPLWRRTKNISRVAKSALLATPGARLLFVVSEGDGRCVEMAPADATLIVPGMGGERGDYAIKINAGYRATTEPFIFTGADDLRFHLGWYDIARAAQAQLPWPQDRNGFGVTGTNDLTNPRTFGGIHSTHSLVARWYADHGAVMDRDHAIYAECYGHEYCDDELVQFAKSKGQFVHAKDALVEHLHPLARKAPDDITYQRGRAFSRMSRRTFIQRRRQWEAE